MPRIVLSAVVASFAGLAAAGPADVLDVKVRGARAALTFEVTVRHDDEGWDHYADAWRVVAPDGAVLATRELLHPHVDEQPFTRSLSGVAVPAGVSIVTVEARDSVHGWGGATVEVELPEWRSAAAGAEPTRSRQAWYAAGAAARSPASPAPAGSSCRGTGPRR